MFFLYIFPHYFFTFSVLFGCLFNYTSICFIKVKAKVHPRKVFEGPEGEWRYSSTLSLTSALDGGVWSTPLPGRECPGTHCIGGWVTSRVGVDGCGNYGPSNGIRSLDRPARSAVAVPTALLVLYGAVLRLFTSYIQSYFFGT